MCERERGEIAERVGEREREREREWTWGYEAASGDKINVCGDVNSFSRKCKLVQKCFSLSPSLSDAALVHLAKGATKKSVLHQSTYLLHTHISSLNTHTRTRTNVHAHTYTQLESPKPKTLPIQYLLTPQTRCHLECFYRC